MPRGKKYGPEEIIPKLREAEVLMSQGTTQELAAKQIGVKTLFIEPGSPWENGYCESFNGRLRDELLAREQFDTLLEAKVLIERWRRHYNTVRPHGSLGYRPPAPEATQLLHFVEA